MEAPAPASEALDDGLRMLMFAAPDGRCYFADRISGEIRWAAETGKGVLYSAGRRDGVEDYLDLKPQDPNKIDWFENNMNIYRFKPDTLPKIILCDTEEEFQQYIDPHIKVTKTKQEYYFHYKTGEVTDCSMDAFKLERVDYHLHRISSPSWYSRIAHMIKAWFPSFYNQECHRVSPDWYLSFAHIKAWFPNFFDQEDLREDCLVYHSRDPQKFTQVCNKYNLHPLNA